MEDKRLMTMTTLKEWLNKNYNKKNGKQFTIGDVQGYVRRNRLPNYLGSWQIISKEIVKGVKTYKVI